MEEESKIKLIIDEQYYEKDIKVTNHTKDKLIFDNIIITRNTIELALDKIHVILNVNNLELLNEYFKSNKGKRRWELKEYYLRLYYLSYFLAIL